MLIATLCRSFLYGTLVAIACRLPSCLQALLRDYWPILFLPQRFILKKIKKNFEDKFENEKAIYARLKDLQGDLIPKFYGEVEFEGSRALVISYVDGQILSDITDLTLEQVQRLAKNAFSPLQQRGVVPDDMKLDNFILVGDRLVLIDLEDVDEPYDPQELEETTLDAVLMLLQYYKSIQRDGKLDW